jgi:hypothetical protein
VLAFSSRWIIARGIDLTPMGRFRRHSCAAWPGDAFRAVEGKRRGAQGRNHTQPPTGRAAVYPSYGGVSAWRGSGGALPPRPRPADLTLSPSIVRLSRSGSFSRSDRDSGEGPPRGQHERKSRNCAPSAQARDAGAAACFSRTARRAAHSPASRAKSGASEDSAKGARI